MGKPRGSIGHFNITAGTLGGLVRDKDSGAVAILSNNHVLADSNNGVPGDPVLQPGPHDEGTEPDDTIATLTRFVPIDFSEGAENRVDGAIATPLNPDDVLWRTRDIGPETPSEARSLSEDDLGQYVHKTGRTTEHAQGFVQAVFATVQVKYDFQKATFVAGIRLAMGRLRRASFLPTKTVIASSSVNLPPLFFLPMAYPWIQSQDRIICVNLLPLGFPISFRLPSPCLP